jgi:hypothetical protein
VYGVKQKFNAKYVAGGRVVHAGTYPTPEEAARSVVRSLLARHGTRGATDRIRRELDVLRARNRGRDR